MTTVKLSELIPPHFHDFFKLTDKNAYLRYVLKGGRGSGKSTDISIQMILEVMEKPITALCVRKVSNTLAESCYEQLKEAIDFLQVSHLWKAYKSPLKLVYTPRGNSIIFRGADDANKIKSIKMSRFPVTVVWFEEAAEFKTEDEITTIENSVLRAELPEGMAYKIYYSYNPPKRKQSWLNKKFNSQFVSNTTWVHHSTYLDNPHISKVFKDEAEEVKKRNYQKYRWEYLGEAVGSGVVPFDNLTFRTITDDELASFDNIRQGLDFGYASDALAFVRWHYDKTRRRIYLLDELHDVKLSNRAVAKWLKQKGYCTTATICDSSEPKSIAEMKELGCRVKGAIKGPDSVEYGERWLDDLDEIIIDPHRTPKSAREFENIDYQVDKDGEQKPKLEDKNNHSINYKSVEYKSRKKTGTLKCQSELKVMMLKAA